MLSEINSSYTHMQINEYVSSYMSYQHSHVHRIVKLPETEKEGQIIMLFSVCEHTVSVLQDDFRELSYGTVTVRNMALFQILFFLLLLLCFEIII